MKPVMKAPNPVSSIAVTYQCDQGHHDIRFYSRAPVSRDIVCPFCGRIAVIRPAEHERHALLMTTLAEWLM
jgi:hypothetical protein